MAAPASLLPADPDVLIQGLLVFFPPPKTSSQLFQILPDPDFLGWNESNNLINVIGERSGSEVLPEITE